MFSPTVKKVVKSHILAANTQSRIEISNEKKIQYSNK
jgi:hypothetical protein